MLDPTADITVRRLLSAWRGGDAVARDRLFELLYAELKVAAAAQLRGERDVRPVQAMMRPRRLRKSLLSMRHAPRSKMPGHRSSAHGPILRVAAPA
eukprot:gene68126-93332_t